MATSKKKNKDNEILRKSILSGLLLGGVTALAATARRTSKLNEKLRDSADPAIKHDKDTVVVSVPGSKIEALGKSASVPDMYKWPALIGSGLLSYAALTALYNKLEDNRMKRLEEESYAKVVGKLVQEDGSTKSAQLMWAKENLWPSRNIAVLLAFLGAAALMKKKLDNNNVDSDKLKPISPNKILFQRKEEAEPASSKNSGKSEPQAKKASEDTSYGDIFKALQEHKKPVAGKGVNRKTIDSLIEIHRALNENAGAKDKFVNDALMAGDHNILALLSGFPGIGEFIQNQTLRSLDFGTSRPGWDSKSKQNSLLAPYKSLVFSDDELPAKGISKMWGEVMANKHLRKQFINNLADKKDSGFLVRQYMQVTPEKTIAKAGVKPMAAKVITEDPKDFDSRKDIIASSYFA